MDALLLLAVIADARPALLGARLEAVQPAGPDGVWLALRNGEETDSLLLSAEEALPRMSRGVARPPRVAHLAPLAAVARRRLPGAGLQELGHLGLDRGVRLRFVTADGEPLTLVAELFGRRPNLLLLDASGTILEMLRRPGQAARVPAIGKPYAAPPASPRPDPALLDPEAVAAALAPALAAGLPPATAIWKSLSGVAPHWAAEAATGAADPSPLGLARSLRALLDRVRAGPWEPHLLLDADGNPAEALPIPLAHAPDRRQEPVPSLGVAVERLAGFRGRLGRLRERRQRLHRLLKRLQDRLRSRRAKLAEDAREFSRADPHQRTGELLVRHQRELPRGRTEVTLPDPAGKPGATLTIPLDPTLSPLANAERLFRAAKRARRGAVRVAARVAETDGALQRIGSLMARLEGATEREDLEAIQRALEASRLLAPRDLAALSGQAGESVRPAKGAKEPSRAVPSGLEPRRFVSTDGIPILVGRNPEGNDHLTLHVARSNDLWLHVQGRAGSHVVVRLGSRAGGLPRRTLIQAAQLAAYYSQARDEAKVAVDYTVKKYVRKPRKAKPGLVSISQEKTIIVSPDKSLIAKLAAPKGQPRE